MRRLPPLKALQAFEAAGRHQSIKQAADELCVTTGAVSQQIKALEDYLGLELFIRFNKAVRLTEAGRACLPLIKKGFNHLHEGIEEAQRCAGQELISVSVAPTFGFKWLLPRLDHFQQVHPDIDLKIDTSTRLVDFIHEDVDLAIRYGPVDRTVCAQKAGAQKAGHQKTGSQKTGEHKTGRDKGMHIELLAQEEVFPVCSPHLLARLRSEGILGSGESNFEGLRHEGLRHEDLRHFALLHFDGRAEDRDFPDWQQWLQQHSLADIPLNYGLRFTSSSMVLQAAIDGQGVAMASSVLAADDLRAGRLVRLYSDSLRAQHHYYLICTPYTSQRQDIQLFIDWIKAEMSPEISSDAGLESNFTSGVGTRGESEKVLVDANATGDV